MYSINHLASLLTQSLSHSLFDAPGTEACASEKPFSDSQHLC